MKSLANFLRTIGSLLTLGLLLTCLENLIRPAIQFDSSTYLEKLPAGREYCLSGSDIVTSFLLADGQTTSKKAITETGEGLLIRESPQKLQYLASEQRWTAEPRPIDQAMKFNGYRFWNSHLSSSYSVLIVPYVYNDTDFQLKLSSDISAGFNTRLNARKEVKQLQTFHKYLREKLELCPLAATGRDKI